MSAVGDGPEAFEVLRRLMAKQDAIMGVWRALSDAMYPAAK